MKKLFTVILALTAIATGAIIATGAMATVVSEKLFEYAGKVYQFRDLPPELQQNFFDNLVKAREQNLGVIDQAVLAIYVNNLAASENKSVLAAREQLLKVDPITDQEVQALYEQFKDQITLPLAQIQNQLRERMESVMIQEKLRDIIETAKKDNGFKLLLPALDVPLFDLDIAPFPAKGAKNSKVTIVEIGDYRCPHCKIATEAATSIVKQHGNEVRLVYIDLPVLTEGGISEKVMEGGYCARQQDKYWAYNAAAFAMQSELSLAAPAIIAQKIGLDNALFDSCMVSDKPVDYVQHSADFARSHGVSKTPTFFINGQRIHTNDPGVDLSRVVQKALSETP